MQSYKPASLVRRNGSRVSPRVSLGLAITLFAMLIVPVAAQVYTDPGDYTPRVYAPESGKWENGNISGYAEGETTIQVVEIIAPANPEPAEAYMMDLCLQVIDKDNFAFIDFAPWDTTFPIAGVISLPNGTTVDYSSGWDMEDFVYGWNAEVIEVIGPEMGLNQCDDGFLGVTVVYRTNGGTAYLTYGGVISYPGAINPDVPGTPVPVGHSAGDINGVFQGQVASPGTKTINFFADPVDWADVEIIKNCFYDWTGKYRIAVRNLGPAIANGLVVVDTLPAELEPILPFYVRVNNADGSTVLPSDTCVWDPGAHTITCTLETLGAIKPLPKQAYRGDIWVIDISVNSIDLEGLRNSATVTSLTTDYVESNNTAVELCFAPTAVELSAFAATGFKSAIDVAWETSSETKNLGFNLYRAESAEGARTLLNGALIPASTPGQITGARYSYTDDTAVAGITYYYWLEDVDYTGKTGVHGPVFAQLVTGAPAAPDKNVAPPVLESAPAPDPEPVPLPRPVRRNTD